MEVSVEECGHEIRNEFHWSQKSRCVQAMTIATRNRTRNVSVTYECSVSAARSDAIPRLVLQLMCDSTITQSVRDEELVTWEETRGYARRICAKQARRRKKSIGFRINFACLPLCTSSVSC